MARRSLLRAMVYAQRAAERKQAAQRREQARRQTQAAKNAEKARKEYEKARIANQKERARIADQKEKARITDQKERARIANQEEKARIADQKAKEKLYLESRIAQVQWQNEQLEQQIHDLEHLLPDALAIDPFINIQALKQTPNIPPFQPGPLAQPEPPPLPQNYMPPAPTGLQKLLPGAKEKYAQAVAKAQETYQFHVAAHANREQVRQQKLAQMRAAYEQQASEERQRIAQQHAEIETFQRDLQAGSPQAVIDYCSMVLASSDYPEDFPQHTKLAYVPESKQLVVEYDLPSFECIPATGSYRYVKTKDEVTTTTQPPAQRKALYSSVIAQITLRTLYELFRADRTQHLDIIVFNGYVESVDKGTGHAMRTCVMTIRTSRDVFTKLNLSQVDPQTCLMTLNASLSKNPAELAPVRPVLEFNMVDPRFIEEVDVLSELDQRLNLMELTPSEFESLITNLFQKMGLETRQTQASRDGGVDCVAFDPRPIFGGKVVIQAKRYKHTVGVSAVRDLYGTMQNEGASKGILVTTSGYGKASFEFADGKPLELLSGSNLLYLLKEHANIDARIQIPEHWKDPQPDKEE